MASTAEKQRSSPDALLAVAQREGRGRLRIFLGASPGVGKTFAMLQAARAAQASGTDVVVGLAETHGRRETEAMVEGFEVLPRVSLPHRGRMVAEFDIDAALARRPQLLLVDEYAHTNAPGSRHPKRWHDVEELINARIDVWTTLNIQHLESLNDVVQRITRVRVRETVPDAAFDGADEIVLVDLPPDELLKRLAEGKVYVQDTAARAVENFFRPNNLVALRELTLRRAAERIDSDLLERMQLGAIEGPWAVAERIMVCVGADPNSARVVRHAKRLAEAIDAPLLAVTVERPGAAPDEARRRAVDDVLQLATSLGAETKTLVGADLVEELLRFAKFENATQIVVGRSTQGRWFAEAFGRSLPHQLVRYAEDIAIHVVTLASEPGARPPRLPSRAPAGLGGYLWSALAVAGAVLVGSALASFVELPNVSMIFLTAVLFSAVRFGFRPGIAASLLSFGAYNFVFIEPLYTFTIARPHEVLALLVFLGVAVLTSTLAGRVRSQAESAVGRARATRRLYEFARRMSGLAEAGAVAEGAVVEVHRDLGRSAVLLRPQENGELDLAASWPPDDRLDTASLSAARWAYDKDEPAGADTATLPNVPWYFVPLRTQAGRVGVLGVADVVDGKILDAEARGLLETIAEIAAAALDRARLAREIAEARGAAETERVRNTLLASISHDFRTPLASIMGAATSLLAYGDRLPDEARRDLLAQVKDEAEHLDGMVRNLLSITRVEAGALELNRDWVDVRETLDRAVAAAKRHGATQRFEVAVASDLPFVRADSTLLSQALANVVGNAVRYGGLNARIVLTAGVEGSELVIGVTDDGPGIDAAVLPHVFEKFARGRSDAGGEGAGLGLAITKGILEAHGGRSIVESPIGAGHGTRIELALPLGPDDGEAADDGTANGSTADGTAADGGAADGTAAIGTAADGAAADDGVADDGAADDGGPAR